MIRTRIIELTGDDFFYLLLAIYLKKRWLILSCIWILIFMLVLSARISSVEYLLISLLIVFQLALVVQYWLYAHSKDNRIYLLPRFFEIDSQQIVERMDDGTSSTIKTERFVRVMSTGKCYLLFVAKNEYVYLPFNAFENTSDREWFESEIVNKIKKS
jgi:hypothetical protein